MQLYYSLISSNSSRPQIVTVFEGGKASRQGSAEREALPTKYASCSVKLSIVVFLLAALYACCKAAACMVLPVNYTTVGMQGIHYSSVMSTVIAYLVKMKDLVMIRQ